MNVQQDIGTIGRAGSAMTAPAPLQQAIDREQDLLERFTSTSPTPRFQRLKQCFLDAEPTIEIDRDRIYTRVMKETDGEPMVTRRAKAFAAVVRQMPVVIAADELLVGHVNVTWMGHRVTAEAPGRATTGMPRAAAPRTSRYPGSLMAGVPASEVRATSSSSSRCRRKGVLSRSFRSW